MSAPHNPPAFPTHPDGDGHSDYAGMELRDWFAGQALASFSANRAPGLDAAKAYAIADAMLEARKGGAA
jgi:hypothetical protein